MNYNISAMILCCLIVIGHMIFVECVDDVYYDVTQRDWTSQAMATTCRLPNVIDKHSHTGQLRLIDKSVVSSDVWVGMGVRYSDWMEFLGCVERSSDERPFVDCNNDTCKVITESRDPFLYCYNHCASHKFMLTSKMCVCNDEIIQPKAIPIRRLNNIFVGKTARILCMFVPAPINPAFVRKPGNCVYIYKPYKHHELLFSNDLCSKRKWQICSSANVGGKFRVIKTNSNWFDSIFHCEGKGLLYPSYSTIHKHSVSASAKLRANKEYWIGTFRRPLEPSCFAALIHGNGTIEKAHPRNCSDALPSLCLQNDVIRTTDFKQTTTDINDVTNIAVTVRATTTNDVHIVTTTTTKATNKDNHMMVILLCSLGALLIICGFISILICLCIKKNKRANRSQRTRRKVVKETSSESVPNGAYALKPRVLSSDGITTKTNVQHSEEYEEINAIWLASDDDNVVYHELNDIPSIQPTSARSPYDHVALSGNTEQNEYDVFPKKGNHGIGESDYDTTVGLPSKEEGNYGTIERNGDKPNLHLNDYDTLAMTTYT